MRRLEPEWLDELPPNAPEAIASRKDLRLVNRLMGNAAILADLCEPSSLPGSGRLVELGAGDSNLLLSLARRLTAGRTTGTAVAVDRVPGTSEQTAQQFEQAGWRLEFHCEDVFTWLEKQPLAGTDVIIANLFLHHFSDDALTELFKLVARRCALFVACEPCRHPLPLHASRLLGVVGCNAVTRHDAPISVRAAFRDRELSALWPGGAAWELQEKRAGFFSHSFRARRVSTMATG